MLLTTLLNGIQSPSIGNELVPLQRQQPDEPSIYLINDQLPVESVVTDGINFTSSVDKQQNENTGGKINRPLLFYLIMYGFF
jgi:hypothetical protein